MVCVGRREGGEGGWSFVCVWRFMCKVRGAGVELCVLQDQNGNNGACRPRPRVCQFTVESTWSLFGHHQVRTGASTELFGHVQVYFCTGCITFVATGPNIAGVSVLWVVSRKKKTPKASLPSKKKKNGRENPPTSCHHVGAQGRFLVLRVFLRVYALRPPFFWEVWFCLWRGGVLDRESAAKQPNLCVWRAHTPHIRQHHPSSHTPFTHTKHTQHTQH